MGAIPVWMTDSVTCAGFSLGEPLVAVEALTNLRTLLDSLRAVRSARPSVEEGNQPAMRRQRIPLLAKTVMEVLLDAKNSAERDPTC